MKMKSRVKDKIKTFWYWYKDYIIALMLFFAIALLTYIFCENFGGDVQYDPNYQPEDELPGGIHI